MNSFIVDSTVEDLDHYEINDQGRFLEITLYRMEEMPSIKITIGPDHWLSASGIELILKMPQEERDIILNIMDLVDAGQC